ncbi:MAG: 30S ribosome-binding factor RbfA [Clostridia bacterium]|nr:30S ribosome-binding factor RbfA [Clostridia bacterium]MBR3804986.1 30S ribosome-binding factor RbfA [Clostridia bacterium]
MRRNNGVNRNDRLNGEFQKEIYEIISRRLKNPLVTEMFSILRVDCSRDLSSAKVYVSVYSKNEEKRKITFDAIKADAKKIRFELAKVIRARTVPELNFILDDSMEYGDKMDRLFKSINEGEKK